LWQQIKVFCPGLIAMSVTFKACVLWKWAVLLMFCQ
jgi:hypothetical protein